MPDAPFAPAQAADFANLAAHITGDWNSIAAVWEDFRVRHGHYLRADQVANKNDFLQQALWAAYGVGQLNLLLMRLQEAGLTTEAIGEAARTAGGGGFQFQSYVNGEWKPQDALVNGRRFLQACDHVCRISIDDEHRGTGVLILPTVVATAAHVVKPLVGADDKPVAGSVRRIKVSFFDADDLIGDDQAVPAKPVTVSLQEDWLGYFSPPAPGEGTRGYDIRSVMGIAHDHGPWDLALLRLAAPPRDGLRGHRLYTNEVTQATFGMHVLHHPAAPFGKPLSLLWSIGTMNQALPDPEHALRWLHNANTDSGSSGAPCFDNDWRIVALHQAGADKLDDKEQSNRAVPIYVWAQQIDTLAATRSATPYLRYALDDHRQLVPVLGRRDLQERAWRAMTAKQPLPVKQRVFVVLGEPGTGKSFTSSILRELAKVAGCPFASLDVRNSASDEPAKFAATVLGAFGEARGDAEPMPTLSTELRDVRNEVVPQLTGSLEQLAGDRSLWLVFDGLEVCDASPHGGPAQIVDALVAALARAPHLHLALLGWKSAVATESAEALDTSVPNAADILDHLLLTMTPAGFELPAVQKLFALDMIEEQLNAQPPESPPYQRAVAATNATRERLKRLLAKAANAEGGGA